MRCSLHSRITRDLASVELFTGRMEITRFMISQGYTAIWTRINEVECVLGATP